MANPESKFKLHKNNVAHIAVDSNSPPVIPEISTITSHASQFQGISQACPNKDDYGPFSLTPLLLAMEHKPQGHQIQ